MAGIDFSARLRKTPAVHDAGRDLFDARQLHAWLQVKDEFNHWWADRLRQYKFEAGLDFSGVSPKTRAPGTRGRPRKDYGFEAGTDFTVCNGNLRRKTGQRGGWNRLRRLRGNFPTQNRAARRTFHRVW